MRAPLNAVANPASYTAAFASCTNRGSSDTCITPLGILRKPSSAVITARAEATSPCSWPPIPSAVAKNQPCDCTCAGPMGSTCPIASSLFDRTLPGSVRSANSRSSIRRSGRWPESGNLAPRHQSTPKSAAIRSVPISLTLYRSSENESCHKSPILPRCRAPAAAPSSCHSP